VKSNTHNPIVFPSDTYLPDWRAFENGQAVVAVKGESLPAIYDYQEGLHRFQVSGDVWLRTLTVARGGEGNASQHIIAQRSKDGGKTWGDWFDVEPQGPPPSSYGGFFRHSNTGQAYYMYTLGPESDPPLADGSPFRGHRHHIGQIAFRYVNQAGEFSERYILSLPPRAVDTENVFAGRHTLHYGHPVPHTVIGDDGYGWYTKIGPEPLVSDGEAFVVRYKGYAHNDRLDKLEIELLPKGAHGLQHAEAQCICGFAPIFVDGKDWFFKFRSTTGYAGLAESHDLGETWHVGDLTYAPGGQPVKNAESPFGVVHDHEGRTFLTFYNDSYSIGFGSFAARDLVYVSHVQVRDHKLYISQPELLYYRQDRGGYERHSRKRLNPPRLHVTPQGLFGQGSDKLELRRFRVPEAFFDTLAAQWHARGVPQGDLVLDAPTPTTGITAPQLPDPSQGGGFAVSCSVHIEPGTRPRTVILDGLAGKGLRILTWQHDALLFAMSDGRHTVRLTSDVASLPPGVRHQVTIIVDGLPGLLSIVIDGRLQDGGTYKERGTARFGHDFSTINGTPQWYVGPDVQVADLRVHSRFLLTSEAVALHRVMQES
jgi:hypothetical protein